MQSVKLGKYKIAYWHPSESKTIFSKMFNDLPSTKQFAQSIQEKGYVYTIMTIKVISDGAYTWEVLEEGVGKHIPLLSQLYHYKDPILVGCLAYIMTKLK
jgi:hypothetical protein